MRKNNNLQHISSLAVDTILDPSNTVFPPEVTDLQAMAEALQPHTIAPLAQATTTTTGVTRIATEQEVLDGLEAFAYVTPMTLQSKWMRPTATEVVAGITRFATTTELNFPGVNTLGVHAAGVWDVVRNKAIPTNSVRGTLAIASDTEAQDPNNDTKAMTPKSTKASIDFWVSSTASDATEAAKGVVQLGVPGSFLVSQHNGFAVSPRGFIETRATEARVGTIQVATAAQVAARVDDTVAVTPAKLARPTPGDVNSWGVLPITSVPQAGATQVAFSADGAGVRMLDKTTGGHVTGNVTVSGLLGAAGMTVTEAGGVIRFSNGANNFLLY